MAQKKVQKASAKKPIAKKPVKTATKKAAKPIAKKTSKPAPKKVVKPVVKKVAPKKAAKPVAKKVAPKKVAKPIAKKVAPKKVVKPVAKKVAPKKVVKPIAKKAAPKKVVKATSTPLKKSSSIINKKSSKPLAKPAKKSTTKTNSKAIIKKTSKPVAKTVSKATPTKKATKPVAKPVAKAPVKKTAVVTTKKVVAKPSKPVVKVLVKTAPKAVVEAPKKKVAPIIEKPQVANKIAPKPLPTKADKTAAPHKEDKVESSKSKATIHHEDVNSKPILSLPKDIKGTVVNVVKPKLNREEKKALKEKLKLKAQAQKKAHSKIDYVEVRRLAKIKAQAEIDNYLKLNPSRRLLKLEFVIRSSPTILYTFLKSSSCLALWFCDVCSENGNDYSFTWNGDTQFAVLVEDHDDESVKYKWVSAPKEEFIEFSISKSEISFDTILTIREFIDAGDEASQSELWGEQVKSLVKHIGG